MELQFIQIGSIALICLIIGQIVKAIPTLATKWIPIIVAVSGGILGAIGLALGIPGLVELNVFDAIATGIFSGIMSSGAYSLYKNLSNQYSGNNVKEE